MKVATAIVVATLLACHATPTVTLDTGDACGLACTKLATWGCVEAEPSPAGESCASFCSREKDALPVACVIEAGSIDAAQRCGVCQ